MSKLIDKATAHFETVLAQGLCGPIHVPEWDADVYYKPSTTMFEESKIIELTQQGKTTEALVTTLIMRARDEEGKHLFGAADKQKLMRSVDPKVILSVVTQMSADNEDIDDALGN
jgi:hypothetical protein